MRQWPELALVCEYIPDGLQEVHEGGAHRENGITPLREYLGRARKRGETPKREIVGYILGKVEDRPVLHPPARRAPSKVVPLYSGPTTSYNNGQPSWDRPASTPQWEKTGHVTSLAVHSHARRLGIASSLLRQLHYHLSECYSASAVGLHVRISNSAAVRLYVETLEYDVADIIPQYYGDGEDAYFMRKNLQSWDELNRVERLGETRPQSRQQTQGNQIPDWVNRDTRSSFFDNRSSMRDMLSPEEKAWVSANNNGRSPNIHSRNNQSLTGKVSRSFRTFLNGGEPQSRFTRKNFRRQDSWHQMPPWETGPVELRLPRYCKIGGPSSGGEKMERNQGFVRGGDASVVGDGFEETVTASGAC